MYQVTGVTLLGRLEKPCRRVKCSPGRSHCAALSVHCASLSVMATEPQHEPQHQVLVTM